VPAVLGLQAAGRLVVLSESVAPGRPLLVSSGARCARAARRIADLEMATEWLLAFTRACEVRQIAWSAGEHRERLARALVLFQRTCGGGDGSVVQLCADLAARSAALDESSIPIVMRHDDFGPWNVYRDGAQLTVIDWELDAADVISREGLPLTDLVYFATHWLYAARRVRGHGAQLEAFRALLDGQREPFVRAARHALGVYADRLGLDRRFVPLLFALTWIERANDRLGRRAGSHLAGTDPAMARYCRYVQLIAERGPRFFESRLDG
jgi:hypothetical protein